ncbi:MAG: class I SAM-dependent methyltransferase [Solirubrobacteraceae bacterium]
MPVAVDLRFDPAREETELRAYLGTGFELDRLWRYQEQLVAEFAASSGEQMFYRTSTGYLYDLTAFAMTGTKLPYLRTLTRHVPAGARLLDYGCGIGSDGLMLLEAGYRVEFADFQNPSTEYLRWRLARRGLDAPVHDLDAGVPGGFAAAYAFDVIEHVQDPFAFLGELEARAALVGVNFLAPGGDDLPLHRRLPIRGLLRHAARRRLRSYRVLHGRSHLVFYDSVLASGSALLISGARLASGLALSVSADARR